MIDYLIKACAAWAAGLELPLVSVECGRKTVGDGVGDSMVLLVCVDAPVRGSYPVGGKAWTIAELAEAWSSQGADAFGAWLQESLDDLEAHLLGHAHSVEVPS